VEEDLLRASAACFLVSDYDRDPRIRDLHYRCYNFQAWHLGAIGLTGLALRDAEMCDYAVHSRYGLKHLLAHDVRDDGLFWERSVGYHHFVIQALLPWTEAMRRCGVDLYGLQVPSDRSHDEDCHYVTDTSGDPKSLAMMFQAPFYMAFPDLSYVALGDSDRGRLRPNWTHLVAWNRYRSPHLDWLLRRETGFGASVGFLHYYRYRYRYDAVKLDGRPVTWSRLVPTFQVSGNTILADDNGSSQSDHFLLTKAARADFSLDWEMTRVEDRGKDDRAWLAFHVNPHNTGFRKSFSLHGHLPEVGRRYQFRLEVKGPQARLLRDGTLVSSEPTTYQGALGHDWRSLIYDLPGLDESDRAPLDTSVWRDQKIGNTGVFRNGCTLLPSSGVAVLRQQAGDFTSDTDATAVSLSYGPYGGGHGHPDKLSIAIYAQGRQWIPHYGSMPYETSWKTQWTSHTVSHNTLVVDGTSQHPAGRHDRMWPVDSSQDRVIGKLERFDPDGRSACAACDTAYPGLTLTRRVRLHDHCVADRFQVSPGPKPSSAQPRQFDYVVHVDGEFVESSPTLTSNSSSLGDHCGYQHLRQHASARVEQIVSLVFEASREKNGNRRPRQAPDRPLPEKPTATSSAPRLRVWVVPQDGPIEVILADGPANSPTERRPVVIVRQRGVGARFCAVFEPMVPQNPLDVRNVGRIGF
jgi:hypothetical protein